MMGMRSMGRAVYPESSARHRIIGTWSVHAVRDMGNFLDIPHVCLEFPLGDDGALKVDGIADSEKRPVAGECKGRIGG